MRILVAMLLVFAAGAQAKNYLGNPQAEAFIGKMVEEHGFKATDLRRLFAEAEYKQSIIDAMTRPAEKVKPWKDYRKIFYTNKRIDLGTRFWRENADVLTRAQKDYGVDPAVIVAIIGVETYYGRNKGSFRVLDALSTLAFDYPKRSRFFTKQLEHFLLLAREQNQDPLKLKGSYAGAMGFGQFIPSSYRAYAVDYDKDGFADIWNNTTDAIGSVANYFAEHGWKDGEPVATRVKLKSDYSPDVITQGLKPDRTILEFSEHGYFPVDFASPDAMASAMKLNGSKGAEFWFGLHNFYVITRYNHSKLYAMAVYQVSEAIRERMERDVGEN
ncbi:lytic murein transglycosylase B [bacterium SCSIO 12696]|nr:lytic murein transglycosylase B [bacterium SCSIO 12696]